jgi:FkbM family methyltransferase
MIRSQLIDLARRLAGPLARSVGPLPGQAEQIRLRLLPRQTATTTRLFGREVQISDAATFLSGCAAMFAQRSYDFVSADPAPLIIDCGANIGLSCIFFKQRYPACRLVAYEPDPHLCAMLRANLHAFGFHDAAIYNQAIWIENTQLSFWAEGAHSGRIVSPGEGPAVITVAATRLRDQLTRPVSLLKLDIEGAETKVLADCADRLHFVERLFVEYHASAYEEQSLHQLLAILSNAGFRYHLKEAYAAPTPFVERPALLGMEFQVDIFAYREQ